MLTLNATGTPVPALIADRIDALAEPLRAQWEAGGNTPRHCVIDNLLPYEAAIEAFQSFPASGRGFTLRSTFRERKRHCRTPRISAPAAAEVLYAIQQPDIVSLVGAITGLSQLEPDPQLLRGGLSIMRRGDFLCPHIDNSHGPDPTRYRRLNLLYYASPCWRKGDGGHLQLWDQGVREPVTIEARFNRLVIMETNRTSWHSVSPVTGKGARCCISNYYFSPLSPEGREYYHVTSFTGWPGQYARRAVAPLDNWARQFAKRALGLTRGFDQPHAASTELS